MSFPSFSPFPEQKRKQTQKERVGKTVANKTGGNMPLGVISVLSAPNSSMLISARYKLLEFSADSDLAKSDGSSDFLNYSSFYQYQ